MHRALREQIRDRMAHDFADAQLPLRAAGSGGFFVVAGHQSSLKVVMPALAAGIHVLSVELRVDVDGRNKSGHDAVFQL
jgi:hypothetical protein